MLLSKPSNSSFYLTPSLPDEIEKLIDNLDSRKSVGLNSIPVFILKLLFYIFFRLAFPVNQSIV